MRGSSEATAGTRSSRFASEGGSSRSPDNSEERERMMALFLNSLAWNEKDSNDSA